MEAPDRISKRAMAAASVRLDALQLEWLNGLADRNDTSVSYELRQVLWTEMRRRGVIESAVEVEPLEVDAEAHYREVAGDPS